jgi:uncharacterized protein (TIGR03067 family)
MTRYLLLLLGGLCLFAIGCGSSNGGGADQKKIQGTWHVELSKLGGKVSEDSDLLGATITFENDKIVITVGDTKHEGNFTMDSSHSPHRLDVKPAAGNSNKPMSAIYSFESEDSLRICFGTKSRPNNFETSPNTDAILFELKREGASRASIKVSAEKLYQQCKDNSKMAASVFPRDQFIEVSGKVLSSKDGVIALQASKDGDYIECTVNRNFQSALKRAMNINKDDTVRVRGTYNGIGDGKPRGTSCVRLQNCDVVE